MSTPNNKVNEGGDPEIPEILSDTQQVPKDKPVVYVTEEMLERVVNGFGSTVEAAIDRMSKTLDDSTTQKINQATIEISRVLNDHAERINAITAVINQKGPAQVATPGHPNQGGQRAGTETYVDKVLDELLPWVRQKLGTESSETDQEINQLITANWQAAKREFVLLQKANLRRSFRKGLVHPEEVEGLIETTANKLGTPVAHVPI